MGVLLMIGLLAGVAGGALVTAVLGGFAIVLTRRHAVRRRHAWLVFGAVMILLVPALMVAIHFYPLPTVRPGSDYDAALKNLFLRGLAYATCPGAAALAAFFATLPLPGKPLSMEPPPLPSN